MTHRNFFITGLPRSRTAWLANFMTHGDTHCFHDVFVDCPHVDGFGEYFDTANRSNVGVSDPALVVFHERIIEFFPEARWVVILRDIHESIESSQRAFGHKKDIGSGVEFLAEKLEQLIRVHRPLVVPFESLNSDMAMQIARHCVPAFNSPDARNKLLDKLNVQIQPDELKSRVASIQESQINEGGLVWA